MEYLCKRGHHGKVAMNSVSPLVDVQSFMSMSGI